MKDLYELVTMPECFRLIKGLNMLEYGEWDRVTNPEMGPIYRKLKTTDKKYKEQMDYFNEDDE